GSSKRSGRTAKSFNACRIDQSTSTRCTSAARRAAVDPPRVGSPPMTTAATDGALHARLAEEAAERLIRYARIDTPSDEDAETFPSTAKQLDLLNLLYDEPSALGLDDVERDEYGYVFATVPATVDRDVPLI